MEPRQTLLPLELPDDPGPPPSPASSPSPPPAQREAFLRERLLAKARAGRGGSPGHRLSQTTGEAAWETIAPGVRRLPLGESPGSRSMLLELAPGTRFASPALPSATRLECLLLQGDLQLGPSAMRAGDHLQAPATAEGGDWTTRDGARFFLLSQLQAAPA